MLTTSPHLYIRRPSPTTAEFTVTTCPPLTLPLRLALFGILLLRIATVGLVLLAIYTQYVAATFTTATSPTTLPDLSLSLSLSPSDLASTLQALLSALLASPLGIWIAKASSHLPPYAFCGLSYLLLYISLVTRIHTTESVLVLRGLGIQTSSSSSSGAIQKTRFIPTAQIQDVFINEAFRGFEVRYYLVVVVEGEEDVVVVFPRLLPKRRIVEAVWRGIRGCLYEQRSEANGGYHFQGGNVWKDGGGGKWQQQRQRKVDGGEKGLG
ncbi:GPI-GlcNAc transferase complex, PIG-H component-domain-containing protein [Apodospora peruviana]|uniref:GPI-GlcNAc transferase complex, PIG-H component-domain-containing protein n=1 Tax=Apodospora peruviana TaxID=516989 RepID=A0AAE0HYK7_9PEZI|nr:GPI-GlcNAc transferase complex, PIG-H component-domain-containing protein [Apodospora peruviana]